MWGELVTSVPGSGRGFLDQEWREEGSSPSLAPDLALVTLLGFSLGGVYAADLAGVAGVVLGRHPEGVDLGVAQVLAELGGPEVVLVVHAHGEAVDHAVRGVDHVEVHRGGALGVTLGVPLGVLAAVGGPAEAVHRELGADRGVHAQGLHVGLVVAVAVGRVHPVGVDRRVPEGLAVGEDPGALRALGLHLELVDVHVLLVVDGEGGAGLVVGADDDGTPDVVRLFGGPDLRGDVESGDAELAFVVDLVLVVVAAGVAVAGAVSFAVVPAADGEVHVAGERLGPNALTVLVERQVQVHADVTITVIAGGAAGVAHGPQVVLVAEGVADLHVDLREVRVAAEEAVFVLHQDRVAVARVAAVVQADAVDGAAGHRGHRLAVGVAVPAAEVHGVAVVAVAASVVGVSRVLVGAGDGPVVPRGEGQGQVGHVAVAAHVTGLVVVLLVVVPVDVVDVRLLGHRLLAREEEGEDAHFISCAGVNEKPGC